MASLLRGEQEARRGRVLHDRVQGGGRLRPGIYLLPEQHLLPRDAKQVSDRGRLRAGRPGLLGISKELPIGIRAGWRAAVGAGVWSLSGRILLVVAGSSFGLRTFFHVGRLSAFLCCGWHASGLHNLYHDVHHLSYTLRWKRCMQNSRSCEGCPDAAGDLLRSWVISHLSHSSPSRISCTDHFGNLLPSQLPSFGTGSAGTASLLNKAMGSKI